MPSQTGEALRPELPGPAEFAAGGLQQSFGSPVEAFQLVYVTACLCLPLALAPVQTNRPSFC